MKKFLLKIFYFVLPFILLALPLDYGISYFLSQSNQHPGEIEVANDIYNSKANCEVAIYGSSRAWLHISPQIISDSLGLTTYNFGIDGHNFWLQYLRHLELIRYNNKPKKIILSVDIFSLQKRVDLYNPDQFLPYMLWNKNIQEFTGSYIGYNKLDYSIPLIRYAGKFQALKTSIKMLIDNSPHKRYRNNGYLGMEREWNTNLETAKANQKFYEIQLDQRSIELFKSFIQECKNMDIDLIMVYTPEYIEGQKFVSNREKVICIYKEISDKYKLPFYNYSKDTICFDRSLFYNSSHLNKKGSEIFSKKFAHDLKSTYVQ